MIKTLLQARMNQLTELIGQSSRQQQVNMTYGKIDLRSIAFGDRQ
jgi:flagellar protein FliT